MYGKMALKLIVECDSACYFLHCNRIN